MSQYNFYFCSKWQIVWIIRWGRLDFRITNRVKGRDTVHWTTYLVYMHWFRYICLEEKNCTAHLLTSKAFDTITRSSLWVKLQKSNISGKVLELFTVFMTMSSLVLRVMISFHHFSGVILVFGKAKICTRSFLPSI
jgi:hypothetical protein